jgi:DNA-binding HxlR family transcriptional regulator
MMEKNTSSCPVSDLFAFLGKKRMIVLIRALGAKPEMSFSELQAALDAINSRILTERLDEGVAAGYIVRTVSTSKPLKIRYSLSQRGVKLGGKLCDLAKFAQEEGV